MSESRVIMDETVPHITICVCTFRRPLLLRRLLHELSALKTDGSFTYSIVVADNDQSESARAIVDDLRKPGVMDISFCVEPVRNVALVRNRALSLAKGKFVAFIDDDEFPANDWLLQLFRACKSAAITGVLGPVLPYFREEPPRWLEKGGFYNRPRYKSGFNLDWEACRTGNVLFRRQVLNELEVPFREIFGTGGEDQDFFRRLMERGHTFIWCDEGLVYEEVSPARWKRSFILKRALLRGKNSLHHPVGRSTNVARSVLALPIYCLALPFLFLAGRHRFMDCLVRSCDHAGRLLAVCGLNPVSKREM